MAQSTSRSARPITDHDEIRRWAESQGGHPARVARTGRGARAGGDTGIIRIDFPGFSGGKSLEEISWDEWFDAFDENNLALLTGNNPKKPRFNKLVSRNTARGQRSRGTPSSKTRSRKTGQKQQKRSSARSRTSSSSKARRSTAKAGRATKRKARSSTGRKRRSSRRS